MINYILNLFLFLKVKKNLSSELGFQRKFIRETLNVDIEESKKTNDSSLDEKDYKKITDYYGLAVAVMIGESFCKLRDRKMSSNERLQLTYLGALTGLFDDFFDKKDLSPDYIKALLDSPQEMEGENSNEKLILKLYRKVLENSSEPDKLKENAARVFNAQVLSKKQIGSDLTTSEIEDITFKKGGNSVLFYRCCFSDELNETEKQLFYTLGGIWQMENDLLDVYKDHEAGIKTLVTTTDKIDSIRKKYSRTLDEIMDLTNQTGYTKSGKKHFLESIVLFVSVGFVALNVLEKNEKYTGFTFQVEKYNRKNLITDIEKPVNILKIIHYFAKHNPASLPKLKS